MFRNDLIKVLLIEDEDFDIKRVQNTIKPFSDRIEIVKVVSNGNKAVEYIQSNQDLIDVVIMDYQIAGGLMGEDLIRKIKDTDHLVQIIVITKMTINIPDYSFANKLMKAGAFWYCTKYPGDIDDFIYQPTDFIISIINAYQKKILEKERLKSNQKFEKSVNDLLKQKVLIGESPSIQSLREDIIKCARSNVSVLIHGSSGTGKELVAYNIHYRSERKYENFVPINCGGLPHELVESELFGYERGAFTGANKRKPGLFELANKGTIFLDEITEMPLQAQVKLLRVMQDGELEKLGRTEKVKVDVRIISASNKNIEAEVQAKRFREDLYYRLNVVNLAVPDLSERKSDIPILFDHFLSFYRLEIGNEKPSLDKEARELFVNYIWPGNVRELKNVVQRLLFKGESKITRTIAEQALGIISKTDHEKDEMNKFIFPDEKNFIPLKDFEKQVRKKYFEYIRSKSGSDTEAANKLGLAPPNFHRMCKELGLK